MKSLNSWYFYFDERLKEVLEDHMQREKWDLMRDFLLKHGEQLMASAEKVISPLVAAHLSEHKRLVELKCIAKSGSQDKSQASDPLGRVSNAMERADHIVRFAHEIKNRIRSDFPEYAENIIAEFEDFVDAQLGQNGGE